MAAGLVLGGRWGLELRYDGNVVALLRDVSPRYLRSKRYEKSEGGERRGEETRAGKRERERERKRKRREEQGGIWRRYSEFCVATPQMWI